MAKIEKHDSIRSFGRTYTKRFGLLSANPYHADLNLLQSRIIFEIQQRNGLLAQELSQQLEIDKGHISRSIKQLIQAKVIHSEVNSADKREKKLSLTALGVKLFKEIDEVSRQRSTEFIRSLPGKNGIDLAAHLAAAELLMGEVPLQNHEVKIRDLKPGDIGWVINKHGEIYAREYGWNMDFERLVGEIAVDFLKANDPKFERAWIAEARGVRLGCVFLVKESKSTGKLRILLVDPLGRGIGLGSRLVRECIQFSKACGYNKLTLWTNDILHAARKIYVNEGFKLTSEEEHHSFGKDLMGQFWEMELKK